MSDIKYIYKVSIYESKRHTISHTDMYFSKLEDCLWIYDNHYYNSKTDDLEDRYYHLTESPPPKLNDFFDIQIIRVLDNDDRYKSAFSNSSTK